jgi:hypothetical protein
MTRTEQAPDRGALPSERKGARFFTAVARSGLPAVAYFVAAKIGLALAFGNPDVTAVWPPTGIAVAALILFGPRSNETRSGSTGS